MGRVPNPTIRVGARGWCLEESLEMRRRLRVVSTLEVQEGEPVVRARQLGVELERSPIRSDRLVQSPRTREGDRHVLENARIIGMIAQRQTIRGEGRIEIALTF